ncbi:MAG: HIT family protein [Nanoarchaeota archaeon]|nr:HIT family protein [Nanoarchaeota archaeon]MBU1632857.1 HIT family protein [Nanoarchaeota archaeon]
MVKMENCVFCKIIDGDIPCYKIYEDDDFLAFLDVKPHAKGHSVVIPKKHGETIFDLDDNLLQKVTVIVKRVMERIQEVLNPDGFNVGWNHNTAGGQVVPHLHIHIMPRWNSDGGGSMHSIVKNPGDMSVEEVVELLK